MLVHETSLVRPARHVSWIFGSDTLISLWQVLMTARSSRQKKNQEKLLDHRIKRREFGELLKTLLGRSNLLGHDSDPPVCMPQRHKGTHRWLADRQPTNQEFWYQPWSSSHLLYLWFSFSIPPSYASCHGSLPEWRLFVGSWHLLMLEIQALKQGLTLGLAWAFFSPLWENRWQLCCLYSSINTMFSTCE